MQLCMGMEYAQGMLRCGDVVSKHQIQFKLTAPLSGNGSDGIVGFSVCIGKYEGCLVRIDSPAFQDLVSQGNDPVGTLPLKRITDMGHFTIPAFTSSKPFTLKVLSTKAFAMANS